MEILKSIAKRTAAYFGYDIVSKSQNYTFVNIGDYSGKVGAIRYMTNLENIFSDFRLTDGRAGIFPIHDHYFTQAVNQIGKFDNFTLRYKKIENRLTEYANTISIKSAAERIGLEEGKVPALDSEPDWLYYFPWYSQSIEDHKEKLNRSIYLENLNYQFQKDAKSGGYMEGEFYQRKIQVEKRRLFDLHNSLSTNGYDFSHPAHTPVTVNVLVNSDGGQRWIIQGGFHRCCISAALGFEFIPARILNILFRDESSLWPGVVNKIFPESAALEVFDSVFDGRGPEIFGMQRS